LRIKVNDEYRVAKSNLTSITFNRDFEKKTIVSNVDIIFTIMENLHKEDSEYNTETGVNTPTLSLDINND
jgi:hypothetical protein